MKKIIISGLLVTSLLVPSYVALADNATSTASTTPVVNSGQILKEAEMKVKILITEMNAKIKAIRAEYTAKIEAIRKEAKTRAEELRKAQQEQQRKAKLEAAKKKAGNKKK